MMRVARPLVAILAFAFNASAEEPPRQAPAIQLTTLPNPLTAPLALGNRRARLNPGETVDSLMGVFSIRHPDSPIHYVWDPVECRLVFCQRDADLIYLAEGPGPAAPTVGAYGAPNFFGYRLVEDGVPEFLYMHGRLGIEEQIRPGADGQTMVQRFRIENAEHGLILTVPERWKDRVKNSTGSWNGTALKISRDQARAGFSLTYDLKDPPDLPEIAESWTPDPNNAQVGPPAPPPAAPPAIRIEAAPGFAVEPIAIPGDQIAGSVEIFGHDHIAIATRSGQILIAIPDGEEGTLAWSTFLEHPIPHLKLDDAGDMPDSIAVSHLFGKARLFDTDGDGKMDFFKEIDTAGEKAEEPLTLLIQPDWDVFEVALRGPENLPHSGLRLSALGLNPEEPPPAPRTDSLVWIPKSICAEPSSPLITGTLGEAGPFGAQVILADRSSAKQWRVARVMLDRAGETMQGAVVDSLLASAATGKLGKLVAAGSGKTLWSVPENGRFIVKITGNVNEVPFEIRNVHLATDAFEFTFSKPIDRKIATHLSGFDVRSADPLGKRSVRHHRIEAAIIDSDGMTLALRVGGVVPERLMKFDFSQIRSESGEPLTHGPVFYTVNALPALPIPESNRIQPANSTGLSEAEVSAPSSESTESSRESKDASSADSL